MQERLKREYKTANKTREGYIDESDDDDDLAELTKEGKDMRKLMKKLEKNTAYDDSDDEKNPYASSVRVCELTVIALLIISTGGRRAGRGAAASPPGPCDHPARTAAGVALYVASSRDEDAVAEPTCDREDGGRVARDVADPARQPRRALGGGDARDEPEDAEAEDKRDEPRGQPAGEPRGEPVAAGREPARCDEGCERGEAQGGGGGRAAGEEAQVAGGGACGRRGAGGLDAGGVAEADAERDDAGLHPPLYAVLDDGGEEGELYEAGEGGGAAEDGCAGSAAVVPQLGGAVARADVAYFGLEARVRTCGFGVFVTSAIILL